MTTTELSYEFDVMYNNIMSNSAPGLDEYEKSVFLTQAQEAIVVAIYNGNLTGTPFEGDEEVTRYISNLNVTLNITTPVTSNNLIGIDPRSVFYQLPTNVLVLTYESVRFTDTNLGCKNNTIGIVKPITRDKYYSINRNPFKGSNTRRVLKITDATNVVELISSYTISSYLVSYIKKPLPIILNTLTNDTINGLSAKTECELDSILHRVILEKAVYLAKKAWSS